MASTGSLDFVALPKIELHAHLSGSISRQCLHETWARKKARGEPVELSDPLIVMPPNKHDYDVKTFFPLFSSYIYHLINDLESLDQSTRSVIADFATDGVVYLELRTTPRPITAPLGFGNLSSDESIDKAGYVSAVLDSIAGAQRDYPQIHVRLILSVDRRNTAEEALQIVALAERFRDRGVVGVDLGGDPTKGDVATFTPAFRRTRAIEGLGITVHFAEIEANGREELETILGWGPDRLGHVIHVPDDMRQRILTDYGKIIGLELCLSCNVHAGLVDGGFAEHHFGRWWREEGVTIIPCTDDVGVFGSPVSNEWRLIVEHFGLNREDVLGLTRRGIDAIFGGDEEKSRLRKLMW